MSTTLQEMFQEYCNIQGFILEEELSNEKHICYSFDESKEYNFHDWKGNYLSTETKTWKKYLWIGKKGAVDFTLHPSFKNTFKDHKIAAEMRNWCFNRK